MLLPFLSILAATSYRPTDFLVDLTKKSAAAKTIVINVTIKEQPDLPEMVGQKLTIAIDRSKNRFCAKNTEGSIAIGYDGKEITLKLKGQEMKRTVESGMSPYAAFPGFEAFLDAEKSKWKVAKDPSKKEVTLTTELDSFTKTIKLTFAEDGTLTGYTNTNGTRLADRFDVTSIKFDVPVTDADLKMP